MEKHVGWGGGPGKPSSPTQHTGSAEETPGPPGRSRLGLRTPRVLPTPRWLARSPGAAAAPAGRKLPRRAAPRPGGGRDVFTNKGAGARGRGRGPPAGTRGTLTPPAVAHPVPASLPRLRLRLRLRALLLSGRGRRRRRRRRGIQPGPPPPPPGRDPTMHLFPHPHRPTLPRGMPRREEGRASRPRHDAGAGWGGGGAREGAEREAAGVGGMTTRGGAARARGSCGRQRGSGAPLGPARP